MSREWHLALRTILAKRDRADCGVSRCFVVVSRVTAADDVVGRHSECRSMSLLPPPKRGHVAPNLELAADKDRLSAELRPADALPFILNIILRSTPSSKPVRDGFVGRSVGSSRGSLGYKL